MKSLVKKGGPRPYSASFFSSWRTLPQKMRRWVSAGVPTCRAMRSLSSFTVSCGRDWSQYRSRESRRRPKAYLFRDVELVIPRVQGLDCQVYVGHGWHCQPAYK